MSSWRRLKQHFVILLMSTSERPRMEVRAEVIYIPPQAPRVIHGPGEGREKGALVGPGSRREEVQ